MCINGDPVDIKDVLREASCLKNKDGRVYTVDLVVLIARIWFLEAEIFVKTRIPIRKDHVKSLDEGSRFLTVSLTRTVVKPEYHQIILNLIAEVPRQVESLYLSFNAKNFVRNKVRDVFYKFLVLMMLFKEKASLLKLLENEASLMLPLKHQIGTLHEGLLFVVESEINQSKKNSEDEGPIFTNIEAVAAGVISLCNSCPADKVTEEAVINMEFCLSDLLEKVQTLKTKFKELYLQIPMLNFPKTPGLCFVEFFLKNITQLLSCEHDLVAYATHQIEPILRDLEFIIFKFRDILGEFIENHECKDLHTRLVSAAYQAEYLIDLMVIGNDIVWQHLLWLYHVSEEIRLIKMQLIEIYGNNSKEVGGHNIARGLMPFVTVLTSPNNEEVMVGLNDEKKVIMDRLTRGGLQRDIISIVGTPGIGKTTLANNLFCSPRVACHFHIRAWCCVSRSYRKRNLLLDTLNHIIRLTDNILAMSDEDLNLLLCKLLKKKRYLVVIDDMWSTREWDDLQSSFPNDLNGSRILMTSRFSDMVSKVSDPHPLRPLSDAESWELLKAKIFGKEGCPQELLEVGQQIAKSCKGLPLAIGAVAGLLHRQTRNQDWWEQIEESVSSQAVSDPLTLCTNILELSYKYLPDHLQACLLYFGVFPEDKNIQVQRLLCLWIAEGFVHKLETKNLEGLAEDYLTDLVSRSLVVVVKRRSNGKVKACRVHDLVRDLCLLKAKDENFLPLISTNDEPYSSFVGLDYGVHYEYFNPSNSMTYQDHRLSLCVNREHFVVSKPSGPYVQSLLYFASTDMYPRCPYDVSFISNNFKLLRILDLESINMGNSLANGIDYVFV